MTAYTYELRVEPRLARPCVAYVKHRRTGNTYATIRAECIEDAEAEAVRMIGELEPQEAGVVA